MEHANVEKLNELKFVLGDNYDHLLQMFISNTESMLTQLNALCDSRDANVQEIGQLAHGLKGTSGNVGADSIYKYAVQLDKLAKERDLSVMPELMTEMNKAFEAFKTIIAKKAC